MKMSKCLIAVCLILSLLSCSTNEEVAPKDVTLKSTTVKQFNKWIVKQPYIVTTYYIGTTPANQLFLPCQLDNILYFRADGTLLELEGPLKCGVSDTADYGTWALTDCTLYLNTINVPSSYFNILEFKPKSFKVRSTGLGADFKTIH